MNYADDAIDIFNAIAYFKVDNRSEFIQSSKVDILYA